MSVKTDSTTIDLKQALKFPFSDEHWVQKFLVCILLGIASFMIPFIPLVFLSGYYYRISRRIIAGDGVTALPDWDEWGKLFVDGIKYLGIVLVYLIPFILSILFMCLVMSLPMLSALNPSDNWNGYGADPQMMRTMLSMLALYPMIGLMLLISLVTGLFLPPALMHMVGQDTFGAGFHFSAWWKVFRSNLGGFLLSYLILFTMVTLLYIGYYILVLTVILCFLTPLFLVVTSVYTGLVASDMYAQSYRLGADKTTASPSILMETGRKTSSGTLKPSSTGKRPGSKDAVK
ncbi:MAG: DUF4013 domain-containing protein [Anaerolineaceae bacterium]|nr:DUF4013 domain-containing protein [Anaerolineaceae bacterium]MBN2677768.1 DUF4013 domain-containing protein [Anaerolineaceae bacterium]